MAITVYLQIFCHWLKFLKIKEIFPNGKIKSKQLLNFGALPKPSIIP